MKILLNSSKTMNFSEENFSLKDLKEPGIKEPVFKENINFLSEILKNLSFEQIKKITKSGDKLASDIIDLYKEFSCGNDKTRLKPALFAFSGDVYKEIDTDSYTKEDLETAEERIIILSGLYGVLTPLTLTEPYRLEMGWDIALDNCKKLSLFWKKDLTSFLEDILKNDNEKTLINLASKEYTDAIDTKDSNLSFTNIYFKEKKENSLKTVAVYSKRARGKMADFIVKERIKNKNDLKEFRGLGYIFDEKLSDNQSFYFVR